MRMTNYKGLITIACYVFSAILIISREIYARPGIITTIKGREVEFYGDGGKATEARLLYPRDIFVDANGDIFIADTGNQRIRRVDAATGIITTFAGNGNYYVFDGDGGPAVEASLFFPTNVFGDSHGNIYISDQANGRIRKVDAETGIITTIAGSEAGFGGDGQQAIFSEFHAPSDIFIDTSGNVYIVDIGNNNIRKIDPFGIINSVAGATDWRAPVRKDGMLATETKLNPKGVVADQYGNIYFTQRVSGFIHKVSTTGIYESIPAGNIVAPYAIAQHGETLFIIGRNHIYRFSNGKVTVIAGADRTYDPNDTGNGRPATDVTFGFLSEVGIATDSQGNVFFVDVIRHRVVSIDSQGRLFTVAGGGAPFVYEKEPMGCNASFANPNSSGNEYFVSFNRVYKSNALGDTSLMVGDGKNGFSGDGGPATEAMISGPRGMTEDTEGNLYFADSGNKRIRKVSADGIITTIAGGGTKYQDGMVATEVSLGMIYDIFITAKGDLYFSEISGTGWVRHICSSGTISTVAGGGLNMADGILATQAKLQNPIGIYVDGLNNIFIADDADSRVRKIDSRGIISTVAGTGERGYSGDGGLATDARLFLPRDICIDKSGNLIIHGSSDVRKVEGVGIPHGVEIQRSADFDADGHVGFSDFLLFVQHYGRSQTDPDFNTNFDLDGNGSVNFQDFLIFASEFGKKQMP